MTEKDRAHRTPMTDAEFHELLCNAAVQQGLALPKTPEEVRLFEEAYADQIQVANSKRPELKDLLELGKNIRNSGESILRRTEEADTEYNYQMAARNGKGITTDIEALMNDAINEAKNRKDDE